MRERICNNCGGRKYKVVGQNMVKCMFCGSLYVDEQASKEEEVLVVQANNLAREQKFSEAVEEFDRIITLYPYSFEAYFGRALAKHKIVLYSNQKGTSRRPRFFGEQIVSISEDEDFKKAMQLAPQERAKNFTEYAKRIEKVQKGYAETKKQVYDCIFCVMGEQDGQEIANKVREILNQNEYSAYDLQSIGPKEKEEESFRALETAKVFLLLAFSEEGFLESKHLYDRYFYLIQQHKKSKTSFILAYDKEKIQVVNLPKEIAESKNLLDVNSVSFLQDLEVVLQKQMKLAVKETAKIDTIKIQKVSPKKKEYVDVQNIAPQELGHYDIENLSVGEETRKKWIFLALKNGDFETANKQIAEGLEKNPYDSEILFGKLLSEKGLKTQDEFFANIGNFKDREQIETILRYANKEFATGFVSNWQDLIVEMDDLDYYNAYLTYLASFKTPNREVLISKAEEKAIETENPELIEKVVKCFDKTQVDRYINFYYSLAQKSGNKSYYDKILELDAGHEQSNLALFIRHFKTTEDKLSYRNKTEFENTLKYLDEPARVSLVSAVVDLVTPVAFFDLKKAEKQIDFYLSYIQDQEKLAALAEDIADKFAQMKFFVQAEKYLAIAISKNGTKADLFWKLIKVKCHCRTDQELIISQAKPTDLPEWQTLLEVGDDQEDEKYGAIVSKNNLYQGERAKFVPDTLDKVELQKKLQSFISRNEKVLLEIEKQQGLSAKKGVDYFVLQLKPFEKYIKSAKEAETFDEYMEILDRVYERLDILDLTLDSSINVLATTSRNEGLKSILPEDAPSDLHIKQTERNRKNKFILRFCCIFLEFFPLAFAALLLLIATIVPKEVYLYFSQKFLIASLIFSVVVGSINLAYFVIKKRKLNKKQAAVYLSLFAFGMLNLLLFCVGFYFVPTKMSITSQNELQTLLSNANYANFSLEEDIAFEGDWHKANFFGSFEGNGHTISGLDDAMFNINSGDIQNLNIQTDLNLKSSEKFGVLAIANQGSIKGVTISGRLQIAEVEIAGGLVGENYGDFENCQVKLEIMTTSKRDASIGGLIGKNLTSKNQNVCTGNLFEGTITAEGQSEALNVGGLIGYAQGRVTDISQNRTKAQINIFGGTSVSVGGLIGYGEGASSKNEADIVVTTQNTGEGYAGGLYGKYINSHLEEQIKESSAKIDYSGNLKHGVFVGYLSGRLADSNVALSEGDLYGERVLFGGGV